MNKDVSIFVRSCDRCQRSKIHRHTQAALENFDVPRGRFSNVHIDLVGPLPPSNGHRYLLTMVDRFSRWPEAVPLPDMLAGTVAAALCNTWISRFGAPETISTDQGRQFESELFHELSKWLGSHRTRTTAYHPQANGLVERFHRTLKAAVMCVDPKHWSEKLPMILLGLRTAIREDLNCSVAEMVYGQPLRVPGEFFESNRTDCSQSDFVKSLRQVVQNMKPIESVHHSKQRVFLPSDIGTCKYVFVRIDHVKRPLQHPYEGPYEVIERGNKYMVILMKGNKRRISIDRLKPAYSYNQQLEFLPDVGVKVTPSGHRVRFLA